MRLSERLRPIRMQRIAIVGLADHLRESLLMVGRIGTVDLDRERGATAEETYDGSGGHDPERNRTARELDRIAADAVTRGHAAAVVGWCPEQQVPPLSVRLAETRASVVRLPSPRGVDPPTALRPGSATRKSFSRLVNTYGTVAYPDVDPTLFAGLAYMLMFGMMFGDAGHGLLLVLIALLLRSGRVRALRRWRSSWPFVAGAGAAGTVFGLLYGEFFGPTGVVPVLWIAPMEQPVRLLAAGVGVGAVLLAGAYVMAVVDRWREGGPQLAVYAASGIAGIAVFVGLGLACAGLFLHLGVVAAIGGVTAVVGLVLAGAGFKAAAGPGAAGAAQAVVELFDAVLRIGTNVVSFARLAAFGLVHAALASLVWTATTRLFAAGGFVAAAGGVLVFVLGTSFVFTLEAVIAGIQALRLTFYELFSRMFLQQGRPFQPWRLPAEPADRPVVREAS
ncbi:V-type ATPase 116kDa subunit family protein [Amycolatopsis taiwanensis]|uniref:V-type ATP synthase subunit I n=1 Tax=Amycolatopsis taiwanensis TaxID=342230 RepID=A0A9W6VGA2_9PSEU|nr:V-type ATPase 116kDa subunit family protein [Amycolatopsis taiwanensis]GLY70553.1 hypothetical protein Atai01_71720 [Amycolatopsis taiwanensis]